MCRAKVSSLWWRPWWRRWQRTSRRRTLSFIPSHHGPCCVNANASALHVIVIKKLLIFTRLEFFVWCCWSREKCGKECIHAVGWSKRIAYVRGVKDIMIVRTEKASERSRNVTSPVMSAQSNEVAREELYRRDDEHHGPVIIKSLRLHHVCARLPNILNGVNGSRIFFLISLSLFGGTTRTKRGKK